MSRAVENVLTDYAIENLNLKLENAELREEIILMKESNEKESKEEIKLEEKE